MLLSEATCQNFHPFLIHYAGAITRTLFGVYESLITHLTKKKTSVRAKCKGDCQHTLQHINIMGKAEATLSSGRGSVLHPEVPYRCPREV